MSETKEKIYVGSGIEKFDGNLIQQTICLSDLRDNAKDYIKLKTVKKREVDQYGKTHYVEVDTWKPEKKKQQTEEDDLPF